MDNAQTAPWASFRVRRNYALGINRIALTQFQHLASNPIDDGIDSSRVIEIIQDVCDPARELSSLGFLEAARGNRRSADTQSARDSRRPRIIRHRVLVDRDIGAAQSILRCLSCNVLFDQVNEHQVVIGTSGDDLVAPVNECLCHPPGVAEHLLLVVLEVGPQSLGQRDRLSGENRLSPGR